MTNKYDTSAVLAGLQMAKVKQEKEEDSWEKRSEVIIAAALGVLERQNDPSIAPFFKLYFSTRGCY